MPKSRKRIQISFIANCTDSGGKSEKESGKM
jgi:hypothetical protein